jgi:hypothetical protein
MIRPEGCLDLECSNHPQKGTCHKAGRFCSLKAALRRRHSGGTSERTRWGGGQNFVRLWSLCDKDYDEGCDQGSDRAI